MHHGFEHAGPTFRASLDGTKQLDSVADTRSFVLSVHARPTAKRPHRTCSRKRRRTRAGCTDRLVALRRVRVDRRRVLVVDRGGTVSPQQVRELDAAFAQTRQFPWQLTPATSSFTSPHASVCIAIELDRKKRDAQKSSDPSSTAYKNSRPANSHPIDPAIVGRARRTGTRWRNWRISGADQAQGRRIAVTDMARRATRLQPNGRRRWICSIPRWQRQIRREFPLPRNAGIKSRRSTRQDRHGVALNDGRLIGSRFGKTDVAMRRRSSRHVGIQVACCAGRPSSASNLPFFATGWRSPGRNSQTLAIVSCRRSTTSMRRSRAASRHRDRTPHREQRT